MRCERTPGDHPRRAASLLAILGLVLCCGCWGYPKVSPQAFEAAKVIDNVCNLRDPAQLPKARAVVEQHARDGEITAREARMLQRILDAAEADRWDAASRDARQLLEAQNEYP